MWEDYEVPLYEADRDPSYCPLSSDDRSLLRVFVVIACLVGVAILLGLQYVFDVLPYLE